MKELVDYCYFCNKPLYCLEGFFNGVNVKSGINSCFTCYEQKLEEENEDES